MDKLSELAPNQTPYRYGFNNPVFWSDPTGLFETRGAAQSWIDKWELTNATISYNEYKNVYEITNGNSTFYQRGEDIISSMYSLDTGITIEIIKGGASGGGGNSSGGSKGLVLTESLYSIAGAYGAESFKSGAYLKTNDKIGNFHDRPYKRLSRNAKTNYNFAKSLKYLKKAGTITAVVSGTIDISNGIINRDAISIKKFIFIFF